MIVSDLKGREIQQIVSRHIQAMLNELIGERAVGVDRVRGPVVLPSGMSDTPARVGRMYAELLSGYATPDGSLILSAQFQDDEISRYNGMVIVKDVPFWSLCEHHMCPFTGVAHFGYIPNGKVVGLSKFSRLLEIYARRFQVQERLTQQLSSDMIKYLNPKGCIVIIEATHTCMTMRGARAHGSSTITSSVWGVMDDDPQARNEFLSLIKSRKGETI